MPVCLGQHSSNAEVSYSSKVGSQKHAVNNFRDDSKLYVYTHATNQSVAYNEFLLSEVYSYIWDDI